MLHYWKTHFISVSRFLQYRPCIESSIVRLQAFTWKLNPHYRPILVLTRQLINTGTIVFIVASQVCILYPFACHSNALFLFSCAFFMYRDVRAKNLFLHSAWLLFTLTSLFLNLLSSLVRWISFLKSIILTTFFPGVCFLESLSANSLTLSAV